MYLNKQTRNGFAIYGIRNDSLSVDVVPELGGKIISLFDRVHSKEWLWAAEDHRGLFLNRPEDGFHQSPMCGVDDCLPTINSCKDRGNRIPDHGECWLCKASIDESLFEKGILKTEVHLPLSQLSLQRTLTLENNKLLLHYQLINLRPISTSYIWAWHALFKIHPNDRIIPPPHHHSQITYQIPKHQSIRLDRLSQAPSCIKALLEPTQGITSIRCNTGENLQIRWNLDELQGFGFWLTNQEWHQHTHLALEPMNVNYETLSDVPSTNPHAFQHPTSPKTGP